MELVDKIALVTGASRGIGRAVAYALAKEGAHVVVNYLQSEAAAETLKEEIETLGRKALTVRADVARTEDVEQMVKAALDTFGRIDILVNNAGILPRILVTDMTDETWDRTLAVNLRGVFLCSRAVIRSMMEQKSGKIVSMTSGRGVAGQARGAHYSASKGGIIAFTKSLALEVAPYGINVNAVAPGPTNTDMWRAGGTKEEIEEKLKAPPLPSGIGKPEDVVAPVLFLLTKASKNVTGQVIFMKTP